MPLTISGGARCGTPPSTLRLSGTGATIGGVLVSGAIDFGDVACGAAGDTQTITIDNTSLSPASYTVKGSFKFVKVDGVWRLALYTLKMPLPRVPG